MMIQDLIKQAYLDGYAKGEKCDWVKPQSAKESMASDYAEKQVKNIAYEPVLETVKCDCALSGSCVYEKMICDTKQECRHKM